MTMHPPQAPIRFAFGLHAHQPVDNFGNVFEDHLRHVYEPFLSRAADEGFLPLTLHLSGPLLDWLKAHAEAYLERIGRLVSEGSLELLLAGYYEPILPAWRRECRVEQIHWMQQALDELFGAQAKGLWLTERVWEPDLPGDLVDAGVEYVLVDDRHFVAAGFEREDLHRPFRTEAFGKSLGVFPIDERLRYLIPFQPPEDTVDYLRRLRAAGHPLAVLADDIEKFGGWPGTRDWVYERGWLARFLGAMKAMEQNGEMRLVTFGEALAEVPSGGNAYLPSASYREMEEWSLPPAAFHRLTQMKESLGEERFTRGEAPLVRGSHWRNFLVKYSESNRMHKKTLALAALGRDRGSPEATRRALGRAQCNDAYWHGVFGGLYLKHLRDVVWRNLAEAEGQIRAGEGLDWEMRDMDLDGHPEVGVHSESFSALVSPHRGGSIEELTLFGRKVNLANTLTRRREAYHEAGRERSSGGEGDASHENSGNAGSEDHAPSIHELEEQLRFGELPPVDVEDRALFQERVLPAGASVEDLKRGRLQPLRSWAGSEMGLVRVNVGGRLGSESSDERDAGRASERPADLLEVHLRETDGGRLEKRIRFFPDGAVEVYFTWDPEGFPEDARFATELSLAEEASVSALPEGSLWRFPIKTYSKSESGFDETVQGESVTVVWPIGQRWGRVRLGSS